MSIALNPSRGWKGLPDNSKFIYQETYFLPNETYEMWIERMVNAYCSNDAHKRVIRVMLHNYWFHPSTPPSGNGGTDRGLPISCYVGEVDDSKDGIFKAWTESCYLGSYGGGIGRSWHLVRELGAKVGETGESSGVIPFMQVDNALTNAITQGNLRRMAQADYLPINHPEIEEFIDIRRTTGDASRKAHNLHHGVNISDEFMNKVFNDEMFDLISPYTGEVTKSVSARELWTRIMDRRVTTGEPYLFFGDTVNELKPEEYNLADYDIVLSNLCTEIMLHTSPDKTNICCLSSINLEFWDEIEPVLDIVVPAALDFLDNILQDFIDKTENIKGFESARNAAIEERAIGLGVMGWHTLLQSKMIPFESAMAQGLNLRIFTKLKEAVDKHQDSLNDPCPLSKRVGTNKRNIVSMAVAPTVSISNLCNMTSSGIEPLQSNLFTKKLKQGSIYVANKHLLKILKDYQHNNNYDDEWYEEQILSIKKADGSVQHLDYLTQNEKDVFKTAFEIDQKWVIEHAADRTPLIDQGQSVNLFIDGNSHVQYISDLHILAWAKGLKSLYYTRSRNPNRASTRSAVRQVIRTEVTYEECLSCQ